MNPINGMVMVPVMTPYGTQLIPMTMDQVMSQYGGNQQQQASANAKSGHQQQPQQQQATQLQQQQLQQLRMQQQLQAQAAQMLKNQQAMASYGMANQQPQNSGNSIVNSILQQQAQLILNQQKLDEVKKLAKATKAAIKQNKAALGGSIGGSSVKGGYGTIGDLRYRSGTSSGFSSGSTDPSDSDGSSGISSSHYKNFKSMKMLKNEAPQQHSSSNTSSGWSCGSDDDGTNSFNAKFNIKSTEQRSGSKAAFLQKMVEVLESYFNDEGLKRNQFLMKQLQTNPEGIPLKKIASMRRVKVLTRDLLTVASAVRRSTLLELSRDGTLVKRVLKPACLEPPKPIQTVLAINLEMDTPTVESVTNLFAKYGELTQIRIIRPSSSLPTYLKEFTMWVPDLGVNHCAIVEFETQEQAQAACREINMINRADGKLRVALLKPGARIRRTLYRKYKEDDEVPVTKKTTEAKEPKTKQTAQQKKQKTSQLNLKVYNSKLTQLDSGNGSDGSAEASHSSEDETMARPSVTVTKRQLRRDNQQVIRQPIGPDGTRGFNRKVRN